MIIMFHFFRLIEGRKNVRREVDCCSLFPLVRSYLGLGASHISINFYATFLYSIMFFFFYDYVIYRYI